MSCNMKGKAIIFSAPSGSGKTTIVKHLLQQELNLEFSVSACSREPRENEVNGKDYYFLSAEEFKAGIEKGDFIEWEEVYKDHYYGTLKKKVGEFVNAGKAVLFDIDVNGALAIKNTFPNASLIFLKPPNREALISRLQSRKSETEQSIGKRLKRLDYEYQKAN